MFIILPFSFLLTGANVCCVRGDIQLGNIRNLNNIIFINTSSVYLFLALTFLLFGASWKSFCHRSWMICGNWELW
jgi:hypothetical protein